jgi:hypothetical protein
LDIYAIIIYYYGSELCTFTVRITPSLRVPASERDYNDDLPAHSGVRAENAKREALLKSLEALKIRDSFRHGGMPRCKAHVEILRIESLPPIGPGFPTYTNDNLNIITH